MAAHLANQPLHMIARDRLGTLFRMKRRLLNFLAAVSLVLCLATTALWIRSHWVGEAFIAGYGQVGKGWQSYRKYRLTSAEGTLHVYAIHGTTSEPEFL